MTVLVTGGYGFIGSNIVKELENRGNKVIIIDNFFSSNFRNIPNLKGELVIGDIRDKNIFKKLGKINLIIHEAAITDTTLNEDNLMLSVNYEGFKNILSFCLEKKIDLVYASSAGVYGAGPMPAKETQSLAPLNTYGFSKALCDRLVLNLRNLPKNFTLVGLRYFNVYGPNEVHKKKYASMIYQLYLQIKKGGPPRLFKFGEQKRDFIYIKDVVDITLKAAELKKRAIINVGTGIARSFNDIVNILNQNLNTKFNPEYFDNPYQEVYQEFTQADTETLYRLLKFTPRFSLEEGIKDYLKYLDGTEESNRKI